MFVHIIRVRHKLKCERPNDRALGFSKGQDNFELLSILSLWSKTNVKVRLKALPFAFAISGEPRQCII